VFVGQHENSRSPPTNLAELKVFVEGLTTGVQPIPDWVFKVMDMLEEVNDSAAVANLKLGASVNLLSICPIEQEKLPQRRHITFDIIKLSTCLPIGLHWEIVS
jgi:hypothetical protein